MFADIELAGIPQRLTLDERDLDADTIEYQGGVTGKVLMFRLPVLELIKKKRKLT